MSRMKRNTKVFEIMSKRCDECLFTRNRIVTKDRAAEKVAQCLATGKPFDCHKANLKKRSVTCRGFFDVVGEELLVVRLAKQLDLVREIKEEEL